MNPQTPAKPLSGRAARARADAARSEDAILTAARTLFLEAGYDGVNLDQVAAAAGVSRQTVYNRFGGKEALLRAMLRRHWGGMLAWADWVRESIGGVTFDDPAAKLVQIAGAIYRFAEEGDQIAFTRLVVAESLARPWIGEEFYRFGKAPTLEALGGVLAAMADQGVIDCPHPDLAARQFLGLIQEFAIWPHVMAIGPAADRLPPRETVITEAVATFLCRYGVRHPEGGWRKDR
ncbi:TetR/AcrR family transcriptional regulator [Pseudomonas sp.]|uniref:TetR/AcrR family transcriptional regulator n=1 Tax=Pseudomonas sp. TaxID=306 RepID=UPI0027300158|nr:TetR/AcrR family transcriptional regulator [Pseudomonas sp.]MDP2245172.1 TetR/AcrR family transcriptional regulator [Pseudomonas sp.]